MPRTWSPTWPRPWPSSTMRHAGLAETARQLGQPRPAGRRESERPSWGSSGLPWRAGPQDGVEDSEEAPHAGDEGDRLRPSAPGQPSVVGAEDRIAADGREGGHVEDAPD